MLMYKNFKDNCIVYACIQSGVFTQDEIAHLRFYVQTKSVTNNKIFEVAKQFKCNFFVKRIDKEFDIRHDQQIKIDTCKQAWSKEFIRKVELFLYKENYMIYKHISATIYYLEHQIEISEKFPNILLKRQMLIIWITFVCLSSQSYDD